MRSILSRFLTLLSNAGPIRPFVRRSIAFEMPTQLAEWDMGSCLKMLHSSSIALRCGGRIPWMLTRVMPSTTPKCG